MVRKQRSLKTTVKFEGIALHSGEAVKVCLEPAPVGTGIVFRRSDVEDPADIPALPDYLVHSSRRTILRRSGSEVGMVEHLLSAASGMQVDNMFVTVDGAELPGMDGSTLAYGEHIQKAGIVEQKGDRQTLKLERPVFVRNEGGAEIIALPPSGDALFVRYLPGHPEGVDNQTVSFHSESNRYLEDIAPARTFVRAEEVEKLLAEGYGQGATAENTLVLGGDTPPEMRIEQEPTRHKISDLMGDLALLGADLNADIVATRSGHGLNQALVRELRSVLEEEEIGLDELPEGGYDIRDIVRIIPHRYPFLLVDRVIRVEGTRRAVGLKNVSVNEEFFQGHWPEHPVMPGVLQLEAMAQVAGILLLRKLEHSGKIAVLASIDKVRFRGSVVPGDQLRIEVETLRLNRNRGQVVGVTKVGRRLAAEATLSFALVDA
ncbi:MAG: 3-hydroxyacyl-ACP dehydratase FabZ [Planctomycetota bacterium]|jgi:UDP-3-O-[3-hydroxymyristoyl] N-acetylglucosamine deacetylase/3-hydroxyacyl-[acyl-carrier-protein] dehydratase|nr:3-hydroxyacyl-ACP dehydratase FabZ [Planctomycetota bacterium]